MLYIKVENGQTVDHPVFASNLYEVFGKIPENYEPFNRTNKPTLGHYQLDDSTAVQYAKVDGVWTDLWPIREMTAAEKAEADAQYFQNCENYRQAMIQAAEQDLSKWSDPPVQQALMGFIAKMRDFVVKDPLMPNFIDYPVTPTGKLVNQRGNISLPGSTPTLIG